MEGPFKPGRTSSGREKVKISVNLDRTLTSSSCCKIVEDILKYILYQRHQIPVQYDILLREASVIENENSSCQIGHPNFDEEQNNSQLKCHEDTLKIYQSKEDRLKLKRRRNRLRWLEKVKKVILQYNTLIQRVRNEFEGGSVAAVSFVLGSSVVTGKELFSISFPHDYVVADNDTTNDRYIMLQFFRAFVTNEDIVKIVSRPCSIQKLWLMLQKLDHPTSTSSPTALPCTTSETEPGLCDLIPRSGFLPSRRTQIVEITVMHKSPLGSPMELTPSIGKLISQSSFKTSRKHSSKRSLVFGVNNVSKRYSYSNDDTTHSNSQDSGVTSNSCDSVPDLRNVLQFSNCSDSPDVNVSHGLGLMTPRDVLKGPEPIVETPVISSHNNLSQTMFTASPSRMLASCMSNFNISDAWNDKSGSDENIMWYQVDHVIRGFKDICFR